MSMISCLRKLKLKNHEERKKNRDDASCRVTRMWDVCLSIKKVLKKSTFLTKTRLLKNIFDVQRMCTNWKSNDIRKIYIKNDIFSSWYSHEWISSYVLRYVTILKKFFLFDKICSLRVRVSRKNCIIFLYFWEQIKECNAFMIK